MHARTSAAAAAILTVALLPMPALAADRVLPGGCRQGECSWLRVTRIERVRANAQGELRRVTGRRGTSRYDGEPPRAWRPRLRVDWDRDARAEYAFCSVRRPAYAFPSGDGYILHYLDLFDLAGYQMASARMYMRICHDRDFDPERLAPLRRLGYRPGTRSEQVEDAAPERLADF
jgi:hypothetical protein